uniref:C2H2-type domain-containing protein n=1 Tax=Meloidogyne hapla TaxID=6305 RepID=A0A1I8B849_MELHA
MNDRVKVQCQICNMLILYNRMPIHLEECKAINTIPCGLCPRFFQSQAGMNRHQGQVHSADERGTDFRCHHTDCTFGTNSETSLRSHLNKHITGFRRSCSRSRSRSHSRQPGGNQYSEPQPEPMDQQPPMEQQQQENRPRQEDRQKQENRQQPSVEEVQNKVPRQKVGARSTPIPMDQNIEQSVEDLVEEAPTCSTSNGTEPPSGFYNLRLVDPVKARLIMAEEHKSLDDIIRNLRENNIQLRRCCENRGMRLGPDIIGERIEAYMRTFSVTD